MKTTKPILRLIILSLLLSLVIGSLSFIFLYSLDWVTQTREQNSWFLYGLPLSGLLIVFLYKSFGENSIRGNNLLVESYHQPKTLISVFITPLVLIGTLLTHLFGGSAGREGTALQMAGGLVSAFRRWFKISEEEYQILLVAGVAGGFSAVFGTPWAGILFAFEFFVIRNKSMLKYIVWVIIVSFLSNEVSLLLGATHTSYQITESIQTQHLYWLLPIGLVFGLTSRIFSVGLRELSKIWTQFIKNEYIRIAVGGVLIVLLIVVFDLYNYEGLEITTIKDAFNQKQGGEVFLIKMLLTMLTLSVGFKGGEVTPLFFIGATLGSFVSLYLNIPVSFLAGLGFVAVFGACANAPLASVIMGVELFGIKYLPYLLIVCILAYLISGKRGIYSSQDIQEYKLGKFSLKKLILG